MLWYTFWEGHFVHDLKLNQLACWGSQCSIYSSKSLTCVDLAYSHYFESLKTSKLDLCRNSLHTNLSFDFKLKLFIIINLTLSAFSKNYAEEVTDFVDAFDLPMESDYWSSFSLYQIIHLDGILTLKCYLAIGLLDMNFCSTLQSTAYSLYS